MSLDGEPMPRLNTKRELDLKVKVSQERERRLEKDIQREREKQQLLREKMKHAPAK
jgi:hypothetical protein